MKHNNILFLILSSLAMLSTCGCSDDVDERVGEYQPSLEKHELNVYPREFVFSGKTIEIMLGNINANHPWSFSGVPDWIIVEPMSGDSDSKFEITVKPNYSYDARSTKIFLSIEGPGWYKQKTISVYQSSSYW